MSKLRQAPQNMGAGHPFVSSENRATPSGGRKPYITGKGARRVFSRPVGGLFSGRKSSNAGVPDSGVMIP